MCTAQSAPGEDAFGPAPDPRSPFTSTSHALRMAGAALDYLNAAAAGDTPAGDRPAGLAGAACGEVLIALGEIQAKLTAAHAGFLRRFDAADGHDADGYGSSSSWLAAKAGLPKKAAKAAVRQM